MSMDLEVWSAQSFNLPGQLPRSNFWNLESDEWVYNSGSWQILVMATDDEPHASVLKKLPGANSVAYVTLEPIGADAEGYALLEEVIRNLAKENNGV